MKITQVDLVPCKTERRSGAISRHVVLKVYTDEDIVGIGEFSDLGIYRYMMPDVENLKVAVNKLMVGEDPTKIVSFHNKVSKVLKYYGHHSMPIYPPYTLDSQLVTAMEMAMYDITGKYLNTPIYNLLGGKVRDTFEVTYPLFSCKNPEDIPERLDYVQELYDQGWNRMRYYVGEDLKADERFLQEFRDRFGKKISLKSVDFQRKMYWKDTLYWIERFKPFEFEIVESVTFGEDYEGMNEIRKRTDIPVSEHISSYANALRMIERGAIDIFNVSIQIGGIQTAIKFYNLAEAAGLKCLLSTTQEMSIGTAATAHMGSVIPELHYAGDAIGPVLYKQDVTKERVIYKGATMYLPEGPGLGVKLDNEKLNAIKSPLNEWEEKGSHSGVVVQ
ncbi:mandelate racemase/muconate lactonizing enzyme family protein [Natribacillus halophilus]|uniref:Muconate cycloisomerase n=1 Tax=Natribacillus halophilus TaxID=549003 RepID=A0A1G8RCH0_9BACI|nr:enolase C-terminal domain-like protein [Natribacillus halophilus]SDJ14666.1 muconate cycloisomerase [Natribacillus halophilus]